MSTEDQNTPPTNSPDPPLLARMGYYGCWVITGILLWLPISFLVFGMVGGTAEDVINLLGVPITAATILYGSRRIRQNRIVHQICAWSGVCLLLGGTYLAFYYLDLSERLTGIVIFSGLGEALLAYLLFLIAVIGLMVSLAALFGLKMTEARNQSVSNSPRPPNVTRL